MRSFAAFLLVALLLGMAFSSATETWVRINYRLVREDLVAAVLLYAILLLGCLGSLLGVLLGAWRRWE